MMGRWLLCQPLMFSYFALLMDFSSPVTAIAAFAVATIVILWAGIRITSVADRIADRTGLGEAVIGGVLLGLSTSLPGIAATVSAAVSNAPSLAVSNTTGGIAAQTAFLVIADLTYRRANLEHAASDVSHLVQAAALIALLALALTAAMAPPVTIFAIHPVTLLLFAAYAVSVHASVTVRNAPSWQPDQTSDTRQDRPADEDPSEAVSNLRLALSLAGLAVFLTLAGIAIAWSGAAIAEIFNISETIVGALLTAVATSLPELVTTVAAIRRGALQLAVGGIIGGNTFDVLFIGFADIAYREGSIYHAIDQRDLFLIAGAILMTATMLAGLILRHRKGIGFEGFSILAVYACVVAVQIWLG